MENKKKPKKDENQTGWLLLDYTESYFSKLRDLHRDIQDNVEKSYLHFAYITLCASTLEYCLNNILISHCFRSIGIDSYRRYADTFINMRFPNKLYATPLIISEGKLVLNQNSSSIKSLEGLITLRNKLLHTKEYVQPTSEIFVVGKEATYTSNNPLELLSRKNCLTFGNALGKIKEDVFDNYRNRGSLIENDLLLKASSKF